MNAEIISVGDELQRGEITNSNSAYLARKLNSLGIDIQSQVTIGDDEQQIAIALDQALQEAQYIFVGGGLGPTADDLTLSAVAKALSENIQTDEQTWQHLLDIFAQRQITVQPENKRQAQYIGDFLPNSRGLALGSWIEQGRQRIIILPGPPSEFQMMVDQEVLPRLKQEIGSNNTIQTRALHFLGRPESTLMKDLQPIMTKYPDVQITSYVKPTNIELRLTTSGEDRSLIKEKFDQVTAAILSKEKEFYLGSGTDFQLATEVVNLLKQQQLKITGAESLTGGLFQSTICSVPGASTIFDGGFVTYAASAKEKLLDIPTTVIDRYGVVSSQTAQEMAERSRELLNADLGVSFTGVAGPDSLEGHPAGTVWLGLARRGQETTTKELRLAPYLGRQEIRLLSVQYGLQMILQNLKNNRTIVR